ncbi:MAG: hypothetical protein J7M19_03615 [Planctomycetes bacterium]|nr:hypothetical protein [Planctomycetota bacterium]
MKRRFGGMLFAVIVIAIASPAVFADPGKVLDLVPQDAGAVIAVDSISGFEDALGTFIDAVQPGASAHLSAKLHQKLTFDADIEGGVDFCAPAAVVVFLPAGIAADPEKDASAPELVPALSADEAAPIVGAPEEAAVDSPDEPQVVGLMRIQDLDAWRAALGDRTGKKEGAAYDYVDDMRGSRNYFTVRGDYVAFAETPEALDKWSEALATPLAGERRSAIENALTRAPICAAFSVSSFREANPDLVDSINLDKLPPMPGFSGPQKAVLAAELAVAKDIYKDIDEALFELAPSAEGIKVTVNADMVKDSLFGRIVSEQQGVDLSDITLLPANPVMLGAMSLKVETAKDYIGKVTEDLVRSLAASGEESAADEAVGSMADMIEKSMEYGLFDNATFAMFQDQDGPFRVAALYRTTNAPKAAETIVDSTETMYGNPLWLKMATLAGNGAGMQAPEISDEVIAGVPVKVMKHSLDFGSGDQTQADAEKQTQADAVRKMQVKAIKAMYGDAIVTRVAAKEGRVYLAVSPDKSSMENLLSGASAGIDMAKVKKSLETLDATPSSVMLVSVPKMFAFQMAMAKQMMGAPVAPAMSVPESLVYTTAAVSFSGRTARFELNIPVSEINAAKMLAMQMMMQRQMQQMPPNGGMPGPGGAPGGPPPWQPGPPPTQ